MAQPVTGPFSEYVSTRWTGKYRWWYRGARDDAGNLVYAPHNYKSCKARAVGGQLSFNLLGTNGLPYYYSNPKQVNSAYTACYDRFAREAWRDAQAALAVDLAERHSTLKLLTESFGKMAKAIQLTRRRKFSQAWNVLVGKKRRPPTPFGRVKWSRGSTDEAFFSNWMQLRYGWGPLCSTIEDLCAVLAKPVEDAAIRSSAKSEYYWQLIATSGSLKGKVVRTQTWSHRCRMQAKVVISDPLLASLNQYGLVNLASVAYELVTLSFVLDWFLPIGKIIEDQTRFVGLSFGEAFTTYRTHGVDWYASGVFSTPACTVYSTLKQRELWTGAAPTIPNRWQVANGLNAKRCLDALALVTGRLRGKI